MQERVLLFQGLPAQERKVHKKTCRPDNESGLAELVASIQVDLGWLEDAAVTDSMIESLHEGWNYESDDDDDDGCSNTFEKCKMFLLDMEEAAEEDMKTGTAKGIASAKALKTLLVDKVVVGTGEAIHNMWSGGRSIDGPMQTRMETRVEEGKKKAELILVGIVKPALGKSKDGKAIWTRLKESFVDICLSTLRSLVILMEKAPHPGGWGMQPLQEHIQMKKYLQDVSLMVWSYVFYDIEVQVSADELIPPMRQLAMLDCVDGGWMMHGSWSEVLDALSSKCCARIKRIDADDELERFSSQIRKADNSMRCKLMACDDRLGLYSNSDSAPQRWRYQRKCSAMHCSNLEDPENPHELRCEECWYFHWCCHGCKTRSCDFSRQHDMLCAATPPDKAEQTRQEVFALLGWDKQSSSTSANKTCQSCGKKDGPETKLNKRGNKYYCSSLCENWGVDGSSGRRGGGD